MARSYSCGFVFVIWRRLGCGHRTGQGLANTLFPFFFYLLFILFFRDARDARDERHFNRWQLLAPKIGLAAHGLLAPRMG